MGALARKRLQPILNVKVDFEKLIFTGDLE